MKNKLFNIFVISLLIASFSIISILYDNNSRLLKDIEAKNKMINDIEKRDSLYYEKTKEYSEIISKYVSDSGFVLDGKPISSRELVKMANESFNKNDLLVDSLNQYKELNENWRKLYENEKNKSLIFKLNYDKYRDSTFFYKFGFEQAKKEYGFDYEMKIIENSISLKRVFSKIDSALLLFPYYKDKLKKDSITGNWVIAYEKEIIDSQRKKRKQ